MSTVYNAQEQTDMHAHMLNMQPQNNFMYLESRMKKQEIDHGGQVIHCSCYHGWSVDAGAPSLQTTSYKCICMYMYKLTTNTAERTWAT